MRQFEPSGRVSRRMRWRGRGENGGLEGMLAPRREGAKDGSSCPREDVVARIVVDAAVHVHRVLGPGLLESVYEIVLAFELRRRGLDVARQVPIEVVYEDLRIDGGFRADLIVDGCVLVELKSVERSAPVHKKQTLTYVRLANLRLGLLLNFGAALMKDGIARLVNGLPDERPRARPALASSRLGASFPRRSDELLTRSEIPKSARCSGGIPPGSRLSKTWCRDRGRDQLGGCREPSAPSASI